MISSSLTNRDPKSLTIQNVLKRRESIAANHLLLKLLNSSKGKSPCSIYLIHQLQEKRMAVEFSFLHSKEKNEAHM